MVIPLAVLLAGCSVEVDADVGKRVSEQELERTVKDKLEKQVGQPVDRIDCPGDLAAEVGKTTRCTLTAANTRYGLSVRVTTVEGERVNYFIKVDDKPMP